MDLEFKNAYLVCIERQDDVNYVLARSYSMKKAEELAEKAKSIWSNEEVYISVEKIAVNDPLGHLQLESSTTIKKNNSEVCICGKNPGGCIGSLACKCSAIANCKRVTDENPLDFENYNYQKDLDLETAYVDVVGVKRGIFEVMVPEWDPEEIIGLSPNEISSELRKQLKPGLRLLAEVNLDANKVADLAFENLRIYEEEEQIEEEEDVEEELAEDEDNEAASESESDKTEGSDIDKEAA